MIRARRQIVDPLTGARVAPDSPVAVDTGQRIVGRGTVVEDDELDPSRDRFGIDPDAEATVKARVRADKAAKAERTPRGRGKAIPTTFDSPAEATKQFLGMNPELEHATGEADVASDTREFMQKIDVRSGKGHVRLAKSPAGARILGNGTSSESVAARMLKFLFGQAKGKRWRDAPWSTILEYAETLAPDAPIAAPVAAGLQPAEELVSRVREEYGPATAARFERDLNRTELESLADRMEAALRGKCLAPDAEQAARARLATLRKWAKRPQDVPQWSCVGTPQSEGAACTFPAILEDIQRLESSCERDYDPRWPIRLADRACEEGEANDEVGLATEPCAIARQSRADAEPPRKMRFYMGRLID